ncbi:hypothetical protein DYQ91_14365 [Xanthomonas sp. LMG 8989]|nr:hypothetical protein [Xanthomonas sp. LMG 8989]
MLRPVACQHFEQVRIGKAFFTRVLKHVQKANPISPYDTESKVIGRPGEVLPRGNRLSCQVEMKDAPIREEQVGTGMPLIV